MPTIRGTYGTSVRFETIAQPKKDRGTVVLLEVAEGQYRTACANLTAAGLRRLVREGQRILAELEVRDEEAAGD